MVTIHRKKHLAASCLFLLGYSFFFVHVASGSNDKDASKTVTSKPSNIDKNYNNSLSNHEGDHSQKENNHSRKSRSTKEDESSHEAEEPREEGKWEPGRKRKFERSVVLESVGDVAGLIAKGAGLQNTDAISERIGKDEPIVDDLNLGIDVRMMGPKNKNNAKDHPKEEKITKNVETEDNGETAIPELRIGKPLRSPKEPSEEDMEEGSSLRWGPTVKIPQTNLLKEILKLKEHLHLTSDKKDEKDSGFGTDADRESQQGGKNNNVDEDDEEDDEDDDDEDSVEEKNVTVSSATDKKESVTNSQGSDAFDQETMNGTLSLYKLITDVFLPMNTNCTGDRPHPWRALTSSQYAKQISKQEGPNLSHTTKETKSKLSLIFGSDPVVELVPEKKVNPSDPPKIEEAKVQDAKIQDTKIQDAKIQVAKVQDTKTPDKKIPTANIVDAKTVKTNSSNGPSMLDLAETTAKPPDVPEIVPVAQALQQPLDQNMDAAYRVLDSALLILTKSQDTRDPSPPEWWY